MLRRILIAVWPPIVSSQDLPQYLPEYPQSTLTREAIAAELQQHGLKPTDQRLRVAEILMKAQIGRAHV